MLIGFEGRGQGNIPSSLRKTLEGGTVKAVNAALQDGEAIADLAGNSIAVMISHIFDLLSDGERLNLNHDLLLPVLSRAPFFSKEGLHYGYFLSTMDSDIVQSTGEKFDWSLKSSTYVQCQRMTSGPLITSLGSLSRVTAFTVENVQNVDLLSNMTSDLSSFSRSLCVQWRQNKLSEIDITEESIYLSEETLRATLPLLWRVLKSSMFATVIILRSLLGRILEDSRISMQSGNSRPIEYTVTSANIFQLLSWQFKVFTSYETYISLLLALALTPSRNTLSHT